MRRSFYLRILPLFILTLIALCMCGCKTRYITVPKYHFRDSTKMVYRLDSVYLHDSIFVSVEARGDTVYLTKSITKYRDRLRTDTLCISVRDTLTKTVTQTVEKELTLAQSFAIRWFGVLVAILAALLLWAFRKPIWAVARKFI